MAIIYYKRNSIKYLKLRSSFNELTPRSTLVPYQTIFSNSRPVYRVLIDYAEIKHLILMSSSQE